MLIASVGKGLADPARSVPEPVRSAAAFLDGLGLDIRADPDGATLDRTGLAHARASLFDPDLQRFGRWHRRTGVDFDLVDDDRRPDAGAGTLAPAMRAAAAMPPGTLEAIEGPEQPDHNDPRWNGTRGAPAVIAAMRGLRALRDADAPLRTARLLCPALAEAAPGGMADRLAALAPLCDVSTSRVDVDDGRFGARTPWSRLTLSTRLPLAFAPDRPLMIVDAVAPTAATLLDTLLDAAALGVERTYVDPAGAAPGAIAAIARLHDLLAPEHVGTAGPDPRAAPPSVSAMPGYAVTGLGLNGHAIALERGGGRFAVLLWQETPLPFRRRSGSPVQPAPVTVHFAGRISGASLADPLAADPPSPLALRDDTVSVRLAGDPLVLLFDRGPSIPSAT